MRRRAITIPVSEAKRRLGGIVASVRYGREEVVLTHHGAPVARIVPLATADAHLARVRGWLPDDDPFFDAVASWPRMQYRPGSDS